MTDDPKPADTLGTYVLQRPIGKGGMGTVYLAHDSMLQRPVAIKILPPELAADSGYVARFEREATSLAQIRHPNLVHIYAVGREGARHYIAMEYIEGHTVADLVRQRGPLPPNVAVGILEQVLSALEKVHAAGIVHRDLKPANIMIDEDQRAILMDFGLAKPRHDRSVTTSNTIIGTPEYMAPEVAEGRDADFRTDIYALGIVLFEMLTGRVPFRGPSAIATLRQHVEKQVPSPRQFVPDVSPQFEAILTKALAKDPDTRYPTVAAFAADLRQAVEPLRPVSQPRPTAEPTAPTVPVDGVPTATALTLPPAPGRRQWLVATLAAAACVILVGLGMLLLPGLLRRSGSSERPRAEARGTDAAATGSEAPDAAADAGPDDTPGTPPQPKGTGGEEEGVGPPTPLGTPSRHLYAVHVSRRLMREVIRGRLLLIDGEQGSVQIQTPTSIVTVPFTSIVRIVREEER